MRVAITSTRPSLDAEVDTRFGRAQYVLIVDTDSLEFEPVENVNAAAGGGAGIQTAQMVAGKGVEAVLTGNCGPNAFQILTAADIKAYVGLTGTVREVLASLERGELAPVSAPSVPGHFGLGGDSR
jgi:predicted Fe-Mo cluster-binding NifX family protein